MVALIGRECRSVDRRHPDLSGEASTKLEIVGEAKRWNLRHRKIGSLGAERAKASSGEGCDQAVSLRLVAGNQILEVVIGKAQRVGDCRLERCRGGESDELVGLPELVLQ